MAIQVVNGNPQDLIDVRMKRNVVGPGGVSLFKDQEYSLPAEHATYMIYANQAEEIGEEGDLETPQQKYDRLQVEAAADARAGKRRATPQAPIESHDGTGAITTGAVVGKNGAATTIGTDTK